MRILKFILLKVVEVSVIIFVPYWVGKFMYVQDILIMADKNNIFMVWFVGVMHILFLIGIFLILLGVLPWFIKSNWKLAGKKWRKK